MYSQLAAAVVALAGHHHRHHHHAVGSNHANWVLAAIVIGVLIAAAVTSRHDHGHGGPSVPGK